MIRVQLVSRVRKYDIKPTQYRAPYNIQEQNLDGKNDTKFMHYKWPMQTD
jgi:hypothetical protein